MSDACPNSTSHTPCPAGYMAWHEWAHRMRRDWKVTRCPECSLWAIWIATKPTAKMVPIDILPGCLTCD